MADLLDGVDPLALEAAKRAVLTDEFVRFRERAVQRQPVLVQSGEYETLKKAMSDDKYLEKLAIERLKTDPAFASLQNKDLHKQLREAIWHLVSGLYTETTVKGLAKKARDAIRALDPNVSRAIDLNLGLVYLRLREEFWPAQDPSDDDE